MISRKGVANILNEFGVCFDCLVSLNIKHGIGWRTDLVVLVRGALVEYNQVIVSSSGGSEWSLMTDGHRVDGLERG